jgi:hypothetical protein
MKRDRDIFIRTHGAKKRSWLARLGTVAFVAALILLNYWVFLKDSLTISAPTLEKTVQPPPGMDLPAPEVEEAVVPVDIPDEKPATTVAGELRSGETVLQAMQKLGVTTAEALPVISAMEDVLDFRSARAGNTFKIELDRVGKVVEFEFKQSAMEIYVVKRENGKFSAARKNIPMETKVASIGCTIQGALFRSFQRCGGDAKLANMFMNLFAWDFNFYQQAREGDTIRMLIEKIYVDGKFMDYGRILAVEYEGQVMGKFAAFHFTDPDGIEGYYTLAGEALRKEFIKVPEDYTGNEDSPAKVFEPKKVAHNGTVAVQYPAYSRSAVWSVASGTVTFAGQVKKEGWVVEIQHQGGYKSRYSNLSVLAKGVVEGAQVFQKSVIGNLGEKKAAGKDPYLLFTLKKGNSTVDHMKENFPGGEPVPAKFMEQFKKAAARYLDELRTIDVIGIEDSQA